MFTAIDVVALLIIFFAYLGAFSLLGLCIFTRFRYGPRKSRTIGAILIDNGIAWSLLILILGGVSIVRIAYPAVPTLYTRFTSILTFTATIWFTNGRLMAFFLAGDAGQSMIHAGE